MILELVMPLRKRKKQPRKKKYISSKEKQVEEARAWGRWSAVVTSEWSSWRNTFAAPGLYMYLFLGLFFFAYVNLLLFHSRITRPWWVQPMLDVKDPLVFGQSISLLADFVILCHFLLKQKLAVFRTGHLWNKTWSKTLPFSRVGLFHPIALHKPLLS